MINADIPINPPDLSERPVQDERGGCAQTGLFVLAFVLLLGITVGFLLVQNTAEQLIFDGELALPNIRPPVTIAFGLALLIPLVLLAVFVRNRHYGTIYRLWMLAALPMIFSIPARYLAISDAQGILGADILELIVYLFVLRLAERKWSQDARQVRPAWRSGLAISVGLGGLVVAPWVIWGALGSPLDVVIDLASALLMGYAAIRTVEPVLFSAPQSAYSQNLRYNTFVKILVAFLAFGIFSAGLAPVGMQPFLPPILAMLALVVVPLSSWGSGKGQGFSRASLGVFVGLAAAASLVWIDGDEQMIVIGSGPGEIMGYAFRMLALSLGILLVMGVLALALRKKAEDWDVPGGLSLPVAVVVWAGILAVYFIFGQPGFYGEKLFVILKDQADLSSLQSESDVQQRRADVYHVLVHEAQTGQEALLKALDGWRIQYTPFYLENAVEVNGGPLVRLWLQSRPDVQQVLNSPHLRPLKDPLPTSQGDFSSVSGTPWNLTLIQADKVWQQLGVRGKGIVVGQSDSGMQGDHPEVADGYLGAGGDNNYHWLDPWFGTTRPTDWNGHGTHTLAIALGNNVGVAPDADWIGCVNLGRNLGNPAYYLTCMQFMLAPYPQAGNAFTDGDPNKGADVLNNSWGCPPVEGCVPDTFVPALEALKTAGIFVVASAGNAGYGGCGTVSDPIALNADVLSVGAVNRNADLAGFSSLGPVTVDGSNRVKPEILAPGDNVESAFPGDTYKDLSGTSMAGPHLVGVVALIWSANPALRGQIDATTKIIEQTAQPYDGPLPSCVAPGPAPENGVGFGVVDAYAAVQAALVYK